ncbi:MAG: hypothetical protein FWC82_00020 [Firmicutes bacterium]|nr:hypothetical protein [Bacillota bacterium]
MNLTRNRLLIGEGRISSAVEKDGVFSFFLDTQGAIFRRSMNRGSRGTRNEGISSFADEHVETTNAVFRLFDNSWEVDVIEVSGVYELSNDRPHIFFESVAGDSVPAGQSGNIKNTGTLAITPMPILNSNPARFTVTMNMANIGVGAERAFTITPTAAAPEGTHTAAITFRAAGGDAETIVNVEHRVIAPAFDTLIAEFDDNIGLGETETLSFSQPTTAPVLIELEFEDNAGPRTHQLIIQNHEEYVLYDDTAETLFKRDESSMQVTAVFAWHTPRLHIRVYK